MATATDLQLSITAKLDGLNAGLAQAQSVVQRAGRSMRTELGGGAVAAAGGFSKVKEQASRSREAVMFLTGAMREFGGEGRIAQQAVSGVAGALLAGGVAGALLAAVEGARLLATWLRQSKEQAEEAKKAVEGIAAGWERLRVSQIGASAATAKLYEDTQAIEKDKEVLRLKEEIAAAQERVRQGEILSASGAGEFDLDLAQADLARLEESLRARRNLLLETSISGARVLLLTEQSAEAGKRAAEGAKASAAATEEWSKSAKKTADEIARIAEGMRRIQDGALVQPFPDLVGATEGVTAAEQRQLDALGVGPQNPMLFGPSKERLEELAAEVRTTGQRMSVDLVSPMVSAWGAGIEAMITGQKKLGDVFRETIAGMLRQVLEAALKQILTAKVVGQANLIAQNPIAGLIGAAAITGVFAGLQASLPSAREFGGSVLAGEPYLVGERGRPEVFVPDSAGKVVPGDRLGGRSVTLNLNLTTIDGASTRDWLQRDGMREIVRELDRWTQDGRA